MDSEGFSHLATAMTGKLSLLDMTDCVNVKDDELLQLMRTSVLYMCVCVHVCVLYVCVCMYVCMYVSCSASWCSLI